MTPNKSFRAAALLAFLASLTEPSFANDNGLAQTPPLGWRSWNLFGSNVNQTLIQKIMDGMVQRSRTDHEGNLVSLCDLGYCDVGLDDNWQACNDPESAEGMHYHDPDGNPIVNLNLFPDLKAMTDHAHSLGLTAGWYGNNCICHDWCRNSTECDTQIHADVKALVKYGFDSWKLDGCGGENNLVLFNKYVLELSPKPILVENCHWGRVTPFKPDRSLPPKDGCPWNFYRSSGDVRASYGSTMHNLGTVQPLWKQNLSYPGCWAYPDMLQVGVKHGPGGNSDPGLSPEETRSHFGGWAIVSSPLILSHDVNDLKVTDQIWDVISNREVIAVNQAYVGDSGGVYWQSEKTLTLENVNPNEKGELVESVAIPAKQYLSKPLGSGRVAVLLMNGGDAPDMLIANFTEVPGLSCEAKSGCQYHVRDIWNHKDVGVFDGSWSVSVDSHDAAFVVLEPSNGVVSFAEMS